MATCDELATQLSGLQSRLAELQKEQDDPEGTCAALGLTGDDCTLYIKSLGGKIAAVQSEIAGVQQQQQAQGCLNPPPPTYEIIDLGTLGGKTSWARAINNAGYVVGGADTPDGVSHAFLWSESTGMQDLGTLGGAYSEALGINDHGQIVGWSNPPGVNEPEAGILTHSRAFLWSESTGMQDLGTLGGAYSGANVINNAGQVVGWSNPPNNNPSHAFLWSATSGMQDLGTLSGGDSSEANAINNAGQVVGWSSGAVGGSWYAELAFLWSESTGMQDLGTLGGILSEALGINDFTQVTGWSETDRSERVRHAFLWSISNGMQDLGTLGGTHSIACEINNDGQVVGLSNEPTAGNFSAFVWSRSTGMQNIRNLLPPTIDYDWDLAFNAEYQESVSINAFGQMAGMGYNRVAFHGVHAWLIRKHKN